MTEVDRRCFDKIQHWNFPIEEKKMTPGNVFLFDSFYLIFGLKLMRPIGRY